MRQISCADLGCCSEVVTAADDGELMSKLNDHARRAHPDSFRAMTPEMVRAIEKKVAQFTRTV